MSTATMLDQATAMIQKAWGQPIEVLEALAVRRPYEDLLLRTAMHTRMAMAITDSALTTHQNRLHALSRPGHVPTFYEEEQITTSAVSLRVAHTESRAHLETIRRVVEAREAAVPAARAPADRLAQAAVARSGRAPNAPSQVPTPPAPSAAVGPPAPATGPRR
ncbi:hypothetical protein ACIQD1_11455 [Streptomyces sp. NPDC093088]|uniref:hypothetical protein n=1 Tax=Streptomyces sp. NPDC093088 TaxID=3366023 RepID=UPI0038073873